MKIAECDTLYVQPQVSHPPIHPSNPPTLLNCCMLLMQKGKIQFNLRGREKWGRGVERKRASGEGQLLDSMLARGKVSLRHVFSFLWLFLILKCRFPFSLYDVFVSQRKRLRFSKSMLLRQTVFLFRICGDVDKPDSRNLDSNDLS